MERFDEDSALDDSIHAVIDDVWSGVSVGIDELFIGEIEVPRAVAAIMKRMNHVVELSQLGFDGNYGGPSEPLEKYTPDGEPAPASIDPWARGVVPTRKPPAMDISSMAYEKESDGFSSRTPSVSSHRSSRSAKSSKMSSNMGRANARTESIQEIEGPHIFDIDEEPEDFDLSNTNDLYKGLQRARKAAEKEMRQEEQEIEDEFKTLQSEVDKIAKDMKGKSLVGRVAFDQQGNPISIKPAKAESLPAFAVPTGLNITTRDDARVSRDGERSGSAEGKKPGGKKKRGKKIKVAGSREVDAYFEATTSIATSLQGAEPPLNPGVTMAVGENVRQGPPVSDDPVKVSRKTFFARDKVDSMGGHGGSSALSGSRTGGMGAGSGAGGSLELGEGSNTFAEQSVDAVPLSMLQAQFPDIDPLEGAVRVVSSDSPGSAEDEAARWTGGGEGSRHRAKESGGTAPGPLPVKSSPEQRHNVKQLTGGDLMPGTRDREMPVAQISPAMRKKLPPPPAGKVSRLFTNVSSLDGSGLVGESKSGSVTRSPTSRNVKGGGSVVQSRQDITKALF
jgi:hypothetical protein